MRSLKPSTREKKRYLLISGKDLDKNIEKAILEFIGVNGFSKLGFSFVKRGKTNSVICVNREMVDSVRASFCVFPERISVEKVSGTLKALGFQR